MPSFKLRLYYCQVSEKIKLQGGFDENQFLVYFTYICIRIQNPKFETDQESIHHGNVSFYAGGQNCKITEFEYEIVVCSKLH